MKNILSELVKNTNPNWIIRKIETNPALVKYLDQFYGHDLGQRAYTALHGLPAKCKYNNLPTFINFNKGYKERCGKPSTCKCAQELSIKNQRKSLDNRTPEVQAKINEKKSLTYKKNKNKHFERRTDIPTLPGFEYQSILTILSDLVPERYERTLKCYPELMEFIDLFTNEYSPKSFLEKVYIIQTGPPEKTPCGKYPSFRNHWYGFNQFCGPKDICDCARNTHSLQMIKWHNNLSNEQKKHLTLSQQQGMLKKYGDTNSMRVPDIRAQIENTCMYKYNAPTPLQSKTVQEKIKQIHQKTIGCDYPFQSSDIRTKALNTTVTRYGGLMVQAREASYKKYNGLNPFQDKNNKNKTKETSIERYGYSHHRKSPQKQQEFIQTMINTHGVYWPSQIHIDKDVFSILINKEKFSKLCESNSLNTLCDMLNVTPTIIKAWHDKHQLNIYKTRTKSRYEDEIAQWLNDNNIVYKHDKKMSWGKTVDFLINNTAIEFNGLYAHSQYSNYGMLLGIDQYYHYNKYIKCKDEGIQLFTIFEDEWNLQKEIIKNKILIAIGKGNIGEAARKLNIQSISFDESSNFLKTYHLQGETKASVYYGAYNSNNKLVSVMTFIQRKPGVWELNRFASDFDIHSGLFSKMLSFFEKHQKPSELYSFSDNRWSHGKVYETNGFKFQHELAPDYTVTNYKTREHKFNWRKNRIKSKFGIDIEGKTELELTLELKHDRIWDCGKIKWSKMYS